MTARIISGNEIAKKVHAEVAEKVATFCKSYDVAPGLAVVLVGDDPASRSYVRRKERACEEVGIVTETLNIGADINAEHLAGVVADLNRDDRYHGILVQLPLPDHIDADAIIDGLGPVEGCGRSARAERGFAFVGQTTFRSGDAVGCSTDVD